MAQFRSLCNTSNSGWVLYCQFTPFCNRSQVKRRMGKDRWNQKTLHGKNRLLNETCNAESTRKIGQLRPSCAFPLKPVQGPFQLVFCMVGYCDYNNIFAIFRYRNDVVKPVFKQYFTFFNNCRLIFGYRQRDLNSFGYV